EVQQMAELRVDVGRAQDVIEAAAHVVTLLVRGGQVVPTNEVGARYLTDIEVTCNDGSSRAVGHGAHHEFQTIESGRGRDGRSLRMPIVDVVVVGAVVDADPHGWAQVAPYDIQKISGCQVTHPTHLR